jgi:hypothetical protein
MHWFPNSIVTKVNVMRCLHSSALCNFITVASVDDFFRRASLLSLKVHEFYYKGCRLVRWFWVSDHEAFFQAPCDF